MRLDKFLCEMNIGTRSQVKILLKQGKVSHNGRVVTSGDLKINEFKDTICFQGTPIQYQKYEYYMMNKPAGVVSATTDKREKTVLDLLKPEDKKKDIFPVGRLDKATEGLLLFTNDGELLHRLISPKKQVPKVYYAQHEGEASQEDVAAFAQGLTLADGTKCLSALLEPLGPGESLITVYEGKYHQVRRMMASRNRPVTYLERRREGNLSLGDLPRGAVRELTEEEIAGLDGEE